MNPIGTGDTKHQGRFLPGNLAFNGVTHGDTGGDGMKVVRSLIAGASLSLCLCAMATADDEQFPTLRTVGRPIVVKRFIVVAGHSDRVIYVRPAYPPMHSPVPADRSGNPATSTRAQRHVETSASPIHENDNHAGKTVKASRNHETNQSEQQTDKENKSTDAKSEDKQPDDAGALDRLTVQAQKEQATRLAEPDGIESR
jgi:hypothetical protein